MTSNPKNVENICWSVVLITIILCVTYLVAGGYIGRS